MSQNGIIILLSIEKYFNYGIMGVDETIFYDNPAPPEEQSYDQVDDQYMV